jgi:hypothetical protein
MGIGPAKASSSTAPRATSTNKEKLSMLKTKHRRMTVVSGTLALAAIAVVVVTAASASRPAKPHVALSRHALARIESNRSALSHAFPLLTAGKAASGSAHPLPESWAREFATQAAKPVPAGGLAEPDPDLAVYVGQVQSAVSGTLNVWAMPGANDLCLAKIPTVGKGAGVQCVSDANAAAGALSGVDEGPHGVSTAIGLIPRGATTVTVHHSVGPDSTVPATDGLWVINNDPHATSITASTVSGTVAIPTAPNASN